VAGRKPDAARESGQEAEMTNATKPSRTFVPLIPPLIVSANWLLRHGGIDQQLAGEIVDFVGGMLGVLVPVAGIVLAFWLRRES
jgi:hypothetical protein